MKSSLFKVALSLMLVVAMLMTVPYVNAITTGETEAVNDYSSTPYAENVDSQKVADTSSADVISEDITSDEVIIDESLPEYELTLEDDPSVTGKVEADYTINEDGIAWPTTAGYHDITLFETPAGKVPFTYELTGYTPNAVAATPNALGVVFAKDKGGVYVYSLTAYNTSATLMTTLRNVYYVPYNTDGTFKAQTANIAYLSETYDGGTSGNGSVGNTIIHAYEVIDDSYTGEVSELAQSKGLISTNISTNSSGKMTSIKFDATNTNVQPRLGYTLDKFSYKYYVKASGDVVYIYVDMICEDPEDPTITHTWRTLTDCFSLENFTAREEDWKTLYGSKVKLDTAYYNVVDHSDFAVTFGIAVSPKTPASGFTSHVTDVNAVYVSPYTIKNGLVAEEGGSRIYYRNFYQTGLQYLDGYYYYCDDETGYVRTSGTYELNGVTFAITPSGRFELDTSQFDNDSEISFYNEKVKSTQSLNTLSGLGNYISSGSDFDSYLIDTNGEKADESDLVTRSLHLSGKDSYLQTVNTPVHTVSATYSMKGFSSNGNLGIVIAEDENGYYTYKITPTENVLSNIFFNRTIEYHRYTDGSKKALSTDSDYLFDISSILGSDDLLYANAVRVGAKRNSNNSEIYSTVKGGIFETGTTRALSTNYPVADFAVQYYMTVDSDNAISIYAVLSCGDAKWTTYAEEFTADSFAFATDESWLKNTTATATAYRKYTAISHDEISPLFGFYKGIEINSTNNKLVNVEVDVESIDYNFNTTEEHIWKTTSFEATCCTDAYVLSECECGATESNIEEGTAYGHTYDAENLTVVQEADSTTNSIMNGYCTECGRHCYYIEKDYLGNIISELVLDATNKWQSVNQ